MPSEQMRQIPLLSADPNIAEWRATETRGATGRDQFSANRCPPAAHRGKLRTPNSALRTLLWSVPFLLAGTCFWQALPGPRAGSRPSATAAVLSAKPPAIPATKRTLITRPIQDIQVGDWVIAGNPLDDDDLSLGDDVDPDSWKRLELRAPKDDGSFADVVLLRPDWWLEEQEARVGETVDINVPECGISGNAEVLRIGPCPQIAARPNDRTRIVTATFKHQSAHVFDLSVEGLDSPIGTTGNHPFWSEDRQKFVRADELQVGERLRAFHGTPRVTDVQPRLAPEPVYNLEVAVEHVYHVGADGILVHNGTPCLMPPLTLAGREGKLMQHAPDWGFGTSGRVPAGALSKMKAIANWIYSKATQVRQGNWRDIADALFYFKNGNVVVTKPDGTLITILKNASKNKWFNQASKLW